MFVLKFIRFLLGYVRFTATGGFPERFVNLCSCNGINIWDLKTSGGVITACADIRSYKKIRPCARKSGMKVRITEKHALSLIIRQRRLRLGLVAGLVIFIAAMSFLSTRIWSISVIGNSTVDSERILEVMQELDVEVGASNDISVTDYRDAALKMLPELTWIHVNTTGSKAVIEVREADPMPDESAAEKYDLVACADGTLTTLRVFNGTATMPVGSGVLKGDILISGFEENKNLTTDLSGAQGYAEATTSRTFKASVNENSRVTVQKPAGKAYSLSLLFKVIPLGMAKKGNFSSFADTSYLLLNSVSLPFGIVKTSYYTEDLSSRTLTANEYCAFAKAEFFSQLVKELRYVKVKSCDVSFVDTGEKGSVTGYFTCLENIGVLRPMQIEEQITHGD